MVAPELPAEHAREGESLAAGGGPRAARAPPRPAPPAQPEGVRRSGLREARQRGLPVPAGAGPGHARDRGLPARALRGARFASPALADHGPRAASLSDRRDSAAGAERS